MRWPSLRSNELRDLLPSFVRRVVIRENDIQTQISRTDLRQILESGKSTSGNPEDGRRPADENDPFCLTIGAKLKRCGGGVHLVVPPNSAASLFAGRPKLSLVKAVARAHNWYQRVVDGKALDKKSLAQDAGLTKRYARKVFGFAFLAPDIVEAILDGRQPPDLNFEKLSKHIPLSWVEQRMQFGFPPWR